MPYFSNHPSSHFGDGEGDGTEGGSAGWGRDGCEGILAVGLGSLAQSPSHFVAPRTNDYGRARSIVPSSSWGNKGFGSLGFSVFVQI